MKALWAFEPFHQKDACVKGMHGLLRQLAIPMSNIDVGFIVTRSEPELYLAYDVPDKERFTVYPRRLLKKKLQQAKVQFEDKKLHVIDFNTISNTKAVDRLLALATSLDVDIIALYTHARKGYKRFILGSFAETVIHRSKFDLLLINPTAKFPVKIKNILFASDFTSSSKKALRQCIEISRRTKARLTVFHVAEVMYQWSLDEGNPKIHSYRKYVKQMCEWIEGECQKSKVLCEIIVTTEIRPMTNLVLNAAAKVMADLIVVVAKTGPMSALMGGSTTRQLIRASTTPVLVLK
ncbi:MAG: hypothetical protein A2X86_13750 [Bdellovibrionales bacterium GWA2_49_15]|nr:MAG: hypothetical protein A2X86_13750 [Bdellovibrionales bacterium GWA2_49_15]HAZ13591.1 hypothetical protein [Bdellovibrionales bacterium]